MRAMSLAKTILFCGMVVLVWFLVTLEALAASLTLAPNTGSYSAGQTFTAVVRAVPSGKNVNAVEAKLSFDPKVMSVVSVSKDGSVFSLWTTEPKFSNTAGTIEFGGGTPTPFSSTANLVTVTFRAVAEGTGAVKFDSASVLAADGRGTDVFDTATNGNFTVSASTQPPVAPATPPPTPQTTEQPAPPDDEAIIFGDPPRPPEIGSQTFLDPEIWYNTKNGVFTWTLPFDVTAVAIEIATSSDNRPENNKSAIIIPPVENYTITPDNVSDGEQYISINFKNQVGWGAFTNRMLRIDTTPPEPFKINVKAGTASGSFPLLTFEANDTTSGVDYYDLTVADKEAIRITPDEARLGYMLKDLEDGTYTIKVFAVDKAGNTREGSTPVLITAGWVKPLEAVEDSSFLDFFTPINLLIIFLITIIFLQFIYGLYNSRISKQREDKLRRETREIQDQMEKIFSALRDEIYDQINSITVRKRLSEKEKETIDALTQALEVSETLIEKEINDVKTILK